MNFRQNSKEPTEFVIGIIGPVGCNRKLVIDNISNLAKHYSYRIVKIGLSDVFSKYCDLPPHADDQFKRVMDLMTAGNELRAKTSDNSILAKLAAVEISKARKKQKEKKVIYVIDSIKRPEEVEELRSIYGTGFYLFAVHSSEQSRELFLKNECSIKTKEKRTALIERDKDEKSGHGQSTREAFHLADFFLTEDGDTKKVWNTLERFFDIIFGDPFKTPTFHEYAMFMAYAASMRSADLSRQVGAVVVSGNDIISSGANECPRPLGGTYWPSYDRPTGRIFDAPGGRDYMNNSDCNEKEKQKIIAALKTKIPKSALKQLEENIETSQLNDITEYGRVVHAEMDAILGCARRGVSCEKAVVFCTTYPCHNCAKHIVVSGIHKVVFIEPYPKSKAYEMHPDAIRSPEDKSSEKVLFIPFVGVGPRQFVNMFSMTLSAGEKVRRKLKGSFENAKWERATARPRVKSFPISYIDRECLVENEATKQCSKIGKIVIS
jgi:deoxycytidylate deaminase